MIAGENLIPVMTFEVNIVFSLPFEPHLTLVAKEQEIVLLGPVLMPTEK